MSSTGQDLSAYRAAAVNICLRLGLFPIAMEYFPAIGAGATEGSKQKLARADVYIGIFAHRYGYIERGYDKSVTEIEFDFAGDQGLERLCFLVDPTYLWPPVAIDFENRELLREFKNRIEQATIRSLFTTVDDFQAKLMHALVEWKERHPGMQAGPAPAEMAESNALVAAAPPAPALVVGRERDLARLKERLGARATERKRRLIVIRGWPGVGKTTVVTALAHDQDVGVPFPEGVLWASAGEHPDPRAGLTAWKRGLTGREVAPSETLEDLADQVRGLLSERRMLLIVDDVWEAAAAAPFSVGGAECATLLTTRFPDVARELAVSADDIYVLDQLGEDEGFELLRQVAPTVARDHQEKSRALVLDLAGLPLALVVAGRLLEDEAAYGWGIDDLLEELAQGGRLLSERAPTDRYDPLSQAIPTVSALFRRSTDRLDDDSRERFAYLGAFAPKPATFDLEAIRACWLVEDPKPTVRKLTGRGLLEPIKETGRFQMHALLVMHARSLLVERVSLASLFEAQRRHAEHFRSVLEKANELYLEGGDSQARGLQVFDMNWPQIRLGQSWAAANASQHEAAARLSSDYPYVGEMPIYLRLPPHDRIAWGETASAAARRLGDRATEAANLHKLGLAHLDAGNLESARASLQQALAINSDIGRREYEASDLGSVGLVYMAMKDYREAIRWYERAIHTYEEIDAPYGEGIYRSNLGDAYTAIGEPETAIAVLQQALELHRQVEDRRSEGYTLGNLGKAFAALSDHGRAIALFEKNLAIAHELKDPQSEGYALLGLSRSLAKVGDAPKAIACAQQAVSVLTRIGDAAATEAQDHLDRLRAETPL